MNWNWLSWIVVGVVVCVGGLFVVKTVTAKGREVVRLPPLPVDAAAPEPPPQVATTPPSQEELPPECEPLRGQVEKFPDTREKKVQFCKAWLEVLRPKADPVPPPSDACGPERVVTALRSLDRCAKLNEVCELHTQNATANIELTDILAVSDKFPVFVTYFSVNSDTVHGAGALARFVRKEVDADKKRAFMVFGSASPTAADEAYDITLARQRTEAAFVVVNDELSRKQMFGVKTRKGNVGRSLVEDFCGAFRAESTLEKDCKRRDANSRRQAAFIVSYPEQCLEPAGG
jgi:hypothetical protein